MDVRDLKERHDHAKSLYGDALRWMAEVERVYKGEFTVPTDIEGRDLDIVRPSEAYNILHKMHRMLAIRSAKRFESVRMGDTDAEARKADRLEKALEAYYAEHRTLTQRDPWRDAVFYGLLRGRGGLQSFYDPAAALPVRTEALDPMEYFPVYGRDGLRYFTKERMMMRVDLWDYFEGLSEDAKGQMALPNLRPLNARGEPDYHRNDWLRIVEYWDAESFAWMVEDTLVSEVEHDYGFVPLAELRFNSTPLFQERWASMALFGAVLEDIKHMAVLKSKMATGVEQFFFPRLYYTNEDGAVSWVDSQVPPGDWAPAHPDSKFVVLNPSTNTEALMAFMQTLQTNIGQGTINPLVFKVDLPNVSGFLVSQFLSIVQDDLADYRDAAEAAFAQDASYKLRLMEHFADEQPQGGFVLPMPSQGRRRVEVLKASDIDGRHRVRVSVKVDLPQDLVSKTTIYNQLVQRDPVTGMYRIDPETGLELSGLADVIGDMSGMQDRIEWYYLMENDPNVRQLWLAKLAAEYRPQLDGWERAVETEAARQARKEQKALEKDIEQGLSQDALIPADLKQPAVLHQVAALMEQGLTFEGALAQMEQGGPPLGVPGQPAPGGGNPEVEQLLSALFGGSVQTAPPPDGLTGYDGIAPQVLPPVMQGAQPRQSVDQANVMVEAMQRQQRRGALPAPR